MTSSYNISTAQKIWGLLSHAERSRGILLLGMMFIGMLLETLGVGLVIPAIALLTQNDIASKYPVLLPALNTLGNPDKETLVIGGMLVLASVYFIKSLFLAFLAWQQARFAYGVKVHLSQRLYTTYLHQPYTFHLQRNSAQLIRNVITETSLFTGSGLISSLLLITETLVLIGLCSLLVIVEPLGAIIVMCVLSIAAWAFHYFTRKHIARWGEARQHHEGLRIQHLQQGLGGAKDVKLLGREDDFLEQYHIHNVEGARVEKMQFAFQQFPRLWLELLAVCGLSILVISMIVQGRTIDSLLPTLGLFAAAAFRLMPSVNRMLGAIQALRYSVPVVDVLHKELNIAAQTINQARSESRIFNTKLELNKITYTYPDSSGTALKNISLEIKQGESVGFVGVSGAGKSTLIDILLGLLNPDSGNVFMDGNDIKLNMRNWQDQIGYVPQSIFLTDDSLRRNIAFGMAEDQINNEAINNAIKAAQLEEFVDSLPDGVDTLVGERGIKLSGGQRQRIGIARALYHDPAVLVLDEATSSLDTTTEHEVMEAVRALHGTKTVLIVAHRLSTVEHCDRLYRLSEGRLMDGDKSQ